MSRYILTERILNTLRGRGYKLVCKICGNDLKEDQEVESKHSAYWCWQCECCGWKSKRKPKERKRIGREWSVACPACNGTVYRLGRKFYCASCYDESFGGYDNES